MTDWDPAFEPNPKSRGSTPGMNRVSPYFSGLTGGVGVRWLRLTELQNRGDRKTTEKSATAETTVGRTWEKQPISNEATKAKNERQVLLSSSRLALRYWKRITTLLTSAIFERYKRLRKA